MSSQDYFHDEPSIEIDLPSQDLLANTVDTLDEHISSSYESNPERALIHISKDAATIETDEDTTVMTAVLTIVKATPDRESATRRIKLLQKELEKALGTSYSMGDEDEDMDDAELEEAIRDGNWVATSHKPDDADRWRSLLVRSLQ